ncbi:MAG: porin [Rhodocyclaceae bacterium]
MQKKLIALAVAGLMAAPVFAQSSVTVYGRMDIGVMSKDDANGKSVLRVDNSQWTTSRLGFRGTEDLGNGLKAIFQIESRLQNDGDANLNTNRDTFVGLAGGFGEFRAGRNSTPLNNWLGNYDHSGVANAFRATNVNLRGSLETRVSNSLVYAAPKFGGLEVAALYAPDETAGVKNDVYGIGLQYIAGPIKAMYTFHAVNDGVDNHAFGLAYDAGVVTVMGSYFYNKFDGVGSLNGTNGTDKEKAWGLGLAAPVGGAGTFSVGYTAQTNVNGISDNDIDVWAVTYKHNLSKRTFAYTGYQRQDPDNGNSIDTFGVGIAHMF